MPNKKAADRPSLLKVCYQNKSNRMNEQMHTIKALLPQSKFDSAPLPALAALDDVQFT